MAKAGHGDQGAEAEAEPRMVIKGGRNRAVQLTSAGRRRLFGKEAKREFLEWFAATANVVWSARKTGFCHQTV